MDKAVLSLDDVNKLFAWRDKNKDLVRSCPKVMKAIEITFKDNPLRLVAVREDEILTVRFSAGYKSLGNVKARILGTGMFEEIKNTCKMNHEEVQSAMSVYASLMALMAYYKPPKVDRETLPKKAVVAAKPNNKKPQVKAVTYILRSNGKYIFALPQGSHASPKGIFSVRGHYRHYQNGKIVWIAEYRKGTGKKKPKTYKVGGLNDE